MNLDKEAITLLAQILKETGLSEIEYERDNLRIKVSSKQGYIPSGQVVYSENYNAGMLNGTTNFPVAQPSAIPVQNVMQEQNSEDNVVDFNKSNPNAVKSPMVGTVYLSPSPNEPTFVKVGDPVKKGQTLLIIEAMKVLNMIKSPRDGVVKKILVNNEDPVEYDQPLVIVD